MDRAFPVFVSLAGIAVAGIGLFGVIAPVTLKRLLDTWRVTTSLPVTLAVRIIFGAVFLIAAPECRLPAVVRMIGVLEFVGAGVLLVVGSTRLAGFVEWWLQQPGSFVRQWCLGASGLGVLIVYAGA